MSDKQRIIELQKSLRIAKAALERIAYGASGPDSIASLAIDEMRPLDQKASLQGLCGHEKPARGGEGRAWNGRRA